MARISASLPQPGPEYQPIEHPSLDLVNKAGESDSAYIRSHRKDLVAWQNWGAESLSLARSTGRLIFLNISFAACRWSSVMTQESFNNPTIANKINSSYIPIIVDRDDRPDLDRVYMNYVQASTGAGGWPLNVFLTPTLAPIFGGTYFPPTSGLASLLGGGTSATSGTTTLAGKLRRPSFATGNGSPALPVVLDRISDSWKHDRKACEDSGRHMIAQLRGFAAEGMISREGRRESFLNLQDKQRPQITDFRPLSDAPPPDVFVAFEEDPAQMLELDTLDEAYEHFSNRFDSDNGGFGFQPKFLCPINIQFLLQLGAWPKPVEDILGEDCVLKGKYMALKTLEKAFHGGVWDQLGGGFHRYSASTDWLVPKFEKMLYDQALLLSCYAQAWVLTRERVYLTAVTELLTYLLDGPLSCVDGNAFYSSESCESYSPSDKAALKEGAYYLWTLDEITDVLGGHDGRILAAHFGVEKDGNIPEEYDVLNEMEGLNALSVVVSPAKIADRLGLPVADVEEVISKGKAKLFARRLTRDRPKADPKIIAGWNGLAIGSLSLAGSVLLTDQDDKMRSLGKRAVERAVTAAKYIRETLWDSTTKLLFRRLSSETGNQLQAFAEDYAFLIKGLVELYQATWDDEWLAWAVDLTETQISRFHDAQNEGFFSTVETSLAPQLSQASSHIKLPDLILRLKDGMDTAEPSTNGLTAQNLFRLSSLLGNDEKYSRLARRTIMAFEAEVLQHPFLFSSMLAAVVMANEGLGSVVVVGEPTDEQISARLVAAFRRNIPFLIGGTWTVVWARDNSQFVHSVHPIVRTMAARANKTRSKGKTAGPSDDGGVPVTRLDLVCPETTLADQSGLAILVCRPQPTVPSGSPVNPRVCEALTIDMLEAEF